MTLLATLQSGFGFSLDGVRTQMNDLAPANVSVDSSGFGGIAQSFRNVDTGGIFSALGDIATQAGGPLSQLASPLSAIGPLLNTVGELESALAGNPGQALARLQASAQAAATGDFAQVFASLSGLQSGIGDPSVQSILQVAGSLTGATIVAPSFLGTVTQQAEGFSIAITLLSALMRAATSATNLRDQAVRIGDLADPAFLLSRAADLQEWAENSALAGAIANVAPEATDELSRIERDLRDYARSLTEYATTLKQSLGFGEAALAQGVVTEPLAALEEVATTLRRYQDPLSLRTATLSIHQRIEAALPASFGAIGSPLNGLHDGIAAAIAPLVTFVNGLDPNVITAPLTRGVGAVTHVLADVAQAIAAFESTLTGLLTQVRDIVTNLPIKAVADAIKRAIEPIATAISTLEDVLHDSLAAIELAMTTAQEAIETATTEILKAAQTAKGFFDHLADEIRKANIAAILQQTRDAIATAAQALQQIHLEVFFDKAIEVIDTSASIIDAVPFSVLPDDAQQKVKQAVAPIRAISWDNDVATPLAQKLEEVKAVVDTDIIAEVNALFHDLMAWLESINPEDAIRQLEAETFTALLDRLNSVNVETILQPVANALDQAKAALATINLRVDGLATADAVVDQALAYCDQISPATLLTPIQDRIAAIKASILSVIHFETWAERLDQIDETVKKALDRVDFAKLSAWLDRNFDALLTTLHFDASPAQALGQLIVAISGGQGRQAFSIRDVLDWLANDSAQAWLRSRLALALEGLARAALALQSADPSATAARANQTYRGLMQAIESRTGTIVHQRLAPIVQPCDPQRILAPVLAYHTRYAAALENARAAVSQALTWGLSEYTTARHVLQEGLRPLGQLVQRGQEFLSALGLDPTGKTLAQILAHVLVALRPSQILAPISDLVALVRDKGKALVHEGLIVPVKAAITEIKSIFDSIDLSALIAALEGIFQAAREQIAALRPSTLLDGPLSAFEALQASFAAYDPLEPIRATVDAFRQAVQAIAGPESPVRPSQLFASLFAVYHEILDTLSALQLDDLLAPLTTEIDTLSTALNTEVERTGTAFGHLQEALPS